MSRIERFRGVGGRPVLFTAILGVAGLSLATAYGCTAGGEVEPPDGDDKELPGDRDAGGDPVIDDELTAAIAPVDDGHLESLFTLDGSASVTSGRAVDFLWEVEAPEGAGCEGSVVNPSAPVTSFTPACRGPHTVTLTLSFPDDSKSSQAEATFSVENRVPVLSALTTDGAFLPGEAVTLSATVTDEDDEDVPTCTARLAADNVGDPTGLVIPSETSADCSFTITTPPRVDTWKVEVVANDGFDDSLPATLELKPGNDPPVITSLEVVEESVAYACADGACAADAVRVSVEATDDSDDFEELTIELVDVTEGAPDGVTVTATPVTGAPGEYDVVVSREDLGALAGSYTLEARVTEVTAGEDGPATVTQQVSFEVTNQVPVLDEITADDVGHAYVSETETYTATVTVTATATDPEANALTVAVELVTCPTAAAGEPGCGTGELSIDETVSDGSLELAITTPDLGLLAGEYSFQVTVTDADGAVVSDQPTAVVLNLPPVIAPGFTSPVEQSYVGGGVHTALTPLFHDPDGDPLFPSLSVTCPDDSVRSLPALCASGQEVDIAAGVLSVSGPPTNLLGDYVVTGSVTDRAATLEVNRTFTIENSPPTLTRTSTETVTCHHQTATDLTVTNIPACTYELVGTAVDPNGDPLTYTSTEFLTSARDYSATGDENVLSGSVQGGVVEVPFDITTDYGALLRTFNNQTARFSVTVRDPFGRSSTAGMNPRLDNRAPVLIQKRFRDVNNKASPRALPTVQLSDDESKGRYFDDWADGSASFGEDYEFSVVLDASDPDGDPLRTQLDIGCSDTVETLAGGDPTVTMNLPADGVIKLRIPGHVGSCSGGGLQPRYREWTLGVGCVEFPCSYGPVMKCTVTGATSRLTDGMTLVNFGANLIADIQLDKRAAYTCN